MRRAVAAAVLGVALCAAPAHAKDFSLPDARVTAQLMPDGSVAVTEALTYSFSGQFQGAYREIPLRPGESIHSVVVSEDGRSYSPGAPTELGSTGSPGTFGFVDLGDHVRIVWHYRASSETRTFEVSYVMRGLAVAYDDVVDVNLRVWGDEWDVSLAQLSARVVVQGASSADGVRVWGHPASVEGYTELLPSGSGARLTAAFIPPHTWVEMRVLFPRSMLSSTLGATTRSGRGLSEIVAEEQASAEAAARDRSRLDWLKANLGWL
ncbi:MAG: DUF2207 domain-containing protein, partial [Actinomycetota bacterium]